MKKVLHIIKLILATLFSICIVVVVFHFFLSPKEVRFKKAGDHQGLFISQKLFDILVFQYPDYSDVFFEKSIPFNKRGNYAEGFKSLNKAVDIDPKLHLGYRGWLKLHKLKDYKGCLDDLRRLDSLTPNHTDAPWGDNIHYVMGLSYKGLRKHKLALIEFNKSIHSEKDSSWVNPYVFLHKGIIHYREGSFEKALKNFEAYRKVNYGSLTSEYCFWKGSTYGKLNNTDSSLVLLKKSKELYNQGYKQKDTYNEIQDELYLSDIERAINELE